MSFPTVTWWCKRDCAVMVITRKTVAAVAQVTATKETNAEREKQNENGNRNEDIIKTTTKLRRMMRKKIVYFP